MNTHEKNTKGLIAFSLALLVLTVLVAVSWKIKRVQALDNNSNKAIVNQRLGRTTLIASSRDNPFVNLSEGRELPIDLSRTAQPQLAFDRAEESATALASADLDEDGMPDLIAGYSATGKGFVTLHRGNVDSIFPNSAAAEQRKTTGAFTESPFFAPSLALDLPAPPDFLGAGDFDADGHWDLVTAAAFGHSLYWLRGDGRGGFAPARSIELPGRVTALVTGEINRADGLTDIVVGVAVESGPKLLVFEGPEGALRCKPEEFSLPAEATSLTLGQLDDDYPMDLAVGAGTELLIVRGRDRKLSVDETQEAEVREAVINRRSFPFAITSMAVGDFSGDNRTEIALLADDGTVRVMSRRGKRQGTKAKVEEWESELLTTDRLPSSSRLVRAKVSSLPHDDLLVLDQSNKQLQILTDDPSSKKQPGTSAKEASLRHYLAASLEAEDEPVAVLPMRLNAHARQGLVVLQKGQSSPSVVTPQSATTFTVTTTADNGDNTSPIPGSLRAAILSANANPGADTIDFNLGAETPTPTIDLSVALPAIGEAITIDGNTGGATRVQLTGSGASSGVGLRLGPEPSNDPAPFGGSTVRGLVISNFSGYGIQITTNSNVLENNYIGTNYNGTAALGNGVGSGYDGVFVYVGSNNTIGGTTPSARNVISGNGLSGILIVSNAFIVTPFTCENNLVQGNFIGTDVTGAADLGNAQFGVAILAGCTYVCGPNRNHIIGGTTAGARNVIGGNGSYQTFLGGPSTTGNLVQGNFIGTNEAGTAALIGADGVHLEADLSNNTVGGTTPAARNIISTGNTHGVFLRGSIGGNLVQGNFIGTDVTGTIAIRNSDGVYIGGFNDSVGGTAPGARNVISGSLSFGILIEGGSNHVQGNLVGTDASGTVTLGNIVHGVFIGGYFSNTIGGTTEGTRNIISGNGQNGVEIESFGANNKVQGNYIGTDVTGTLGVPNGGEGVSVYGSDDNLIGGTAAGAGNVISGNNGNGVWLRASQILVQGNFIGTQADGVSALGNGSNGVRSDGGNTIGGTGSGASNTIAFNGVAGALIVGTNNSILSNSIFSNSGLGIDLAPIGVTPNDSCDGDSGANNFQNFPVLTSASTSGGNTTIQGTLNSAPNKAFTIQFFSNPDCDPSGFGEGKTFIGSTTVTTGETCNTSFTVTLATSTAVGQVVTATATDPAGNTSEFSQCNQVFSGNQSPVAVCHNVTVSAGSGCTADASIDNGSFDPDSGDTITLAQSPQGPYALGDTSVTLTVTDNNGASSTCIATVTVVDTTPPQVTCPSNITTLSGPGQCSAVVSFIPSVTDNCSGVVPSCSPASGTVFPIGTTSVNCIATDGSGNTASGGFTVTVTNPIPVASISSPPSGAIYAVGAAVSFAGSFTDNTGDLHTAEWSFTSNIQSIIQAGAVNESTGAVTASHSFTEAGVYLVTLTVRDQCGNAVAANTVGPDGLTAMVVIYDPDGGFVTGGGWINSPAGAYVANPALTGKASFGFVSKYQHGANVLTGNTEFQFRVANFNFKSTAYEWLVVAGARAQYKGSGTINGSGNYGFMLTAIDGQINGGGGTDKFRIKIWDKSNGDAIVYDNLIGAADANDPTTAIGEGSIVIHR